MSTNVYVINHNGHPLMPCSPAKARKLLRDGRATVATRAPFTIKLCWECEEHVQEVRLGIDKGSHMTGFSCIGKGQILLSGEIHHRLDVKEKAESSSPAKLSLAPKSTHASLGKDGIKRSKKQ